MSRPGFYFCFCPDGNLLTRQISRHLAATGSDWDQKTIWSDDQGQEDALWSALNLPSMMGPPRAVLLRKCETLPDRFWPQLSGCLKGFKPSIWPFFCFENPWDKKKPKIPASLSKQKFFKFAREKKWIWEFPGLSRQNVPRYISRKCQELGIKTAPGVLEELSAVLPLDSRGIDMELEKLALLAYPEKTVCQDHLQAVPAQLDIDIFSFFKAVQGGQNLNPVWKKIFHEQKTGQGMLFPFLGLLLREARILWLLSTGMDPKVNLYPSLKREKTALARSLGPKRIAMLWDLVLEAETGVKSGRLDTDQAMENLAAKLFKLFSGQQVLL
ncbi:DNA polymerase III subunit delta [Desulfonatronovibrio hydrogenovorans]|uniref:DNA polymerase III subunit delta n=1 Tax=Desulfonatronovibrio hydrogenovorans TaxID=53245 RepID=UPI00048EC273|nr:hypothetical protein [Desulfonatronovibrio hydrogenovorans]